MRRSAEPCAKLAGALLFLGFDLPCANEELSLWRRLIWSRRTLSKGDWVGIAQAVEFRFLARFSLAVLRKFFLPGQQVVLTFCVFGKNRRPFRIKLFGLFFDPYQFFIAVLQR